MVLLVLVGALTYGALIGQLLPEFAAQFTARLPARLRRSPRAG